MPQLSLENANQLIALTLETAQTKSMPPIAVAILDSGGHLKALQRQDGVSFLRADIAQAKAWGALAMACDSRALSERYQQDVQQQGFVNALNSMTSGKIMPLPGGIRIFDGDNNLLGAIGAAGGDSDDDEASVIAAIDALGFQR